MQSRWENRDRLRERELVSRKGKMRVMMVGEPDRRREEGHLGIPRANSNPREVSHLEVQVFPAMVHAGEPECLRRENCW